MLENVLLEYLVLPPLARWYPLPPTIPLPIFVLLLPLGTASIVLLLSFSSLILLLVSSEATHPTTSSPLLLMLLSSLILLE